MNLRRGDALMHLNGTLATVAIPPDTDSPLIGVHIDLDGGDIMSMAWREEWVMLVMRGDKNVIVWDEENDLIQLSLFGEVES